MRGAAADDALGVLDRMTALLEAFGEDDRGRSVSELALRAGLPKSTVSRLSTTLVRRGYLEREGKLLHLGLRLFELGHLAEHPRQLRSAAFPVMAGLRQATGQSVHLAVRDGRELVCVAAMRGREPAPPAARTGARLPMHATALGKAVLAHLAVREVDEVVGTGIEDPALLRQELDRVRRGAPAIDPGGFCHGVSCAAVPVFDGTGAIAGALSASGFRDAFDPDRIAPTLRAAGESLSRRMADSASAPT